METKKLPVSFDFNHIKARIRDFAKADKDYVYDKEKIKKPEFFSIIFERKSLRFEADKEYPAVIVPGKNKKTGAACVLIYSLTEDDFYRYNDEKLYLSELIVNGFNWNGKYYKRKTDAIGEFVGFYETN